MDEKHIAECTMATLCGEDGNDDDKPRVNTAWRITGDGERAGEIFYKDLYLTEKAFEWSLKALRAAGFQGDDITNCETIVGNQAVIVLGDDEYNGEVRTKLKWINKMGGGTPMAGPHKITFAERIKAKIKAQEAGQGDVEEVPFN